MVRFIIIGIVILAIVFFLYKRKKSKKEVADAEREVSSAVAGGGGAVISIGGVPVAASGSSAVPPAVKSVLKSIESWARRQSGSTSNEGLKKNLVSGINYRLKLIRERGRSGFGSAFDTWLKSFDSNEKIYSAAYKVLAL